MASGDQHDKSTKIWFIPFGLVISMIMGVENGVISSISFLIGGLWLSPDLDTNSNATKRWGRIKYLWWPYKKLIPHRSIFSHGPFIGSTLRLAYLAILIIALISLLEQILNIDKAPYNLSKLKEDIIQFRHTYLPVILGVEGSAWLHLIKDGDPLPSELQKRKQK